MHKLTRFLTGVLLLAGFSAVLRPLSPAYGSEVRGEFSPAKPTIATVKAAIEFSAPILPEIAQKNNLNSTQNNNADPELNDLLLEGRDLVDKGKFAEALAVYQQAETLDDENARIFSAIGYLEARQGNFQAAADAYKQAADMEPENSEFHYALGFTFANLEQYDEAAAAYQQAIQLNDDRVDAYLGLGVVR
ncbi:MAG: tetratricopeptide repeat protein, partial [Cyanobacteria bacterium J055]